MRRFLKTIILFTTTILVSTSAFASDFSASMDKTVKWMNQNIALSTNSNQKIKIHNPANDKNEKGTAAPVGSVYTYFKDVAFNFNDAYSNTTSTESENAYIMAHLSLFKNNLTNTQKDNLNLVGHRLLDKIHTVKVYDKNIYVINRYTCWNKGSWVEDTSQYYVEDMIDTGYSLLLMYDKTKNEEYKNAGLHLLNSVSTLQELNIQNGKPEVSGAIFFNISKDGNSFVPSWEKYPLYFTNTMIDSFKKAYSLTNSVHYLNTLRNYNDWVCDVLEQKSLWKNGFICSGVDSYLRPYFYANDNFLREVDINIPKTIETMIGAVRWEPTEKEDLLSKLNLSVFKKDVLTMDYLNSEYVSTNGSIKLNSLKTQYPTSKIMLLAEYSNLGQLSSSISDNILKARRKNTEAAGVWNEDCFIRFSDVYETIYALSLVD